jgi:rhodanese-related sulfurtransferase
MLKAPLPKEIGTASDDSAERDAAAAPVTLDTKYVSIEDLDRLKESGQPFLILDVRTERTFDSSDQQVKGAVRLPPDHVAERARELNLPRDEWLLAYCA